MENKCEGCKHEGKPLSWCLGCVHYPKQVDRFEPAEPKVLTESELVGKIMTFSAYGCKTAFNRQWLSDVIDLCHQNGRLERDLELRGLVERARRFTETVKPHLVIKQGVQNWKEYFAYELQILKPL